MEGQISAKMVLHSIDPRGNELKTLEVVMPRYILAELNTHRMLSRNSASSRAIPFKKMVQEVQERPFIPYAWQKDHKGMQGTEYIDDDRLTHGSWLRARNHAISEASMLNQNIEVTKQLANRLLEPFMYHKVLVSGTEWNNFFNLRCPSYQLKDNEPIFKSWKDLTNYYEELHHDFWTGLSLERYTILERLQHNKGQADIHMMFLAEAIWDATNESTPIELKEGEWHSPYSDQIDLIKLAQTLMDKGICPGWDDTYESECEYDENENSFYQSYLQPAINKISVARAARLSYQTLGDNPVIDYAKDLELYDNLSKSMHFSPFEHVARVMTEDEYYSFNKGLLDWDEDKRGYIPTEDSQGWCLNYRGYIQERYLLEQSWKG